MKDSKRVTGVGPAHGPGVFQYRKPNRLVMSESFYKFLLAGNLLVKGVAADHDHEGVHNQTGG
jgi:hypothetical protein